MKGSRQEKLKVLNRAPGSSLENFSAPVVSVRLRKLFRNVCSVMGSLQLTMAPFGCMQPCPCPPQITVRWKPNSKFDVGRRDTVSEWTHGSLGAVWPFRLPTKKS